MSKFDFPKVLLGRNCQFVKRLCHTLLTDVAGSFTEKYPIQLDSGTGNVFGWWPRHHARMLVPDRGEPTTKIGLFISLFIAAFDAWHVSAGKLASVLSSRWYKL